MPERSRAARDLAETALVRLVHVLGDHADRIIVLGGLVPDILSRERPDAPVHIGTTDVDVLVTLDVMEDGFGHLESALQMIGFEPDPKKDGWRWHGKISGAWVKFEVLCDLEDQPTGAVVKSPEAERLRAANLRGTGYVAEDFTEEAIAGTLGSGERVDVRVRFAGLHGYLMSKAFALWQRGAEKDYYDFVYVLLYNAEGGPAEVAAALLNGPLQHRLQLDGLIWKEVQARFAVPSDSGPRGFSSQSVLADPQAVEDEAGLRQSAISAVSEFLAVLMQGRG
jgi:hypothetical protein